MKLEDRIRAIAEFGFTERQARFLDVVMLFGGLCVPRQYAAFAGTAYGHRVSRFFDKLVQRGYAAVCDCLHNRAELYHLAGRWDDDAIAMQLNLLGWRTGTGNHWTRMRV